MDKEVNEILDRFPNPDGWYDVSKKLPDHGQFILVYTGEDADGEVNLQLVKYDEEKGFPVDKEVTHWRELPEGPKDV